MRGRAWPTLRGPGPGPGTPLDFDRQVAYLATHMSKTAVVALMRIAWRTVGAIIERYWRDVEDCYDRYDGLTRIGIDEISYKKGHKYLTVVVDHDTGRLVWAGLGRDTATLEEFFDLLGPERCAQITLVSADAARYIAGAVQPPPATRRAMRRPVPRDRLGHRRTRHRTPRRTQPRPRPRPRDRLDPSSAPPAPPKHSKTPAGRCGRTRRTSPTTQRATIDWIAATDPRLHEAYLMKEGLRYAFKIKGEGGRQALADWLEWVEHAEIPAFHDVARKIRENLATIDAALTHRLSNALIESTNTKIRLITRTAFGFHHPDALIALALLSLGGHKPTLPGRT